MEHTKSSTRNTYLLVVYIAESLFRIDAILNSSKMKIFSSGLEILYTQKIDLLLDRLNEKCYENNWLVDSNG